MTQPRSKASDLLNRVNALAGAPDVDDLQLARIRRDAESLKAHDPAGAFTVLGILSFLQRDIPAMRHQHGMACKLADAERYFEVCTHYAISLMNAGLAWEAMEQARNIWEARPDDLAALDLYLDAAFTSLHLATADSLIREREKRQPGRDDERLGAMKQVIRVAQERGFFANELAQIPRAIAPLFEDGLFVSQTQIAVSGEGGDTWLDMIHYTNRSPEAVADLNVMTAEMVVEAGVPDEIMMFVVMRFTRQAGIAHRAA